MQTSTKILFWTPRLLCILAILFISMFALDAFEPGETIWRQLLAFVIHLVPSFILTALLVVAWRWELIGGIIFAVIGIMFTPFIYSHNYQMNHSFWTSISIVLMITFPFVLVGGLFLYSHFLKKRQASKHHPGITT